MTSITAGAAILPTTLGGVQAVIPLGLTSLLLVLMQDLDHQWVMRVEQHRMS